MSDVGEVSKLIMEVIKIGKELFPDEVERFEKEWKNDRQTFQKAYREKDVSTLNLLVDKYWSLLLSLT